MEQLVIILLIALISFINWLVKKSAALREERKRRQASDKGGESLRSDPPPPQPEREPDIHMRRLKEALGLPDEVEPPPLSRRLQERLPTPAAPPPQPPPLPVKPVFSPVSVSRPREEFRAPEFHPRIGKPARPKIQAGAAPSRIRELLGSSGGLRDAVVLSEILGPPKCLRAGEGALWK